MQQHLESRGTPCLALFCITHQSHTANETKYISNSWFSLLLSWALGSSMLT